MKRKNQFSTSNKYWLLILAIICIVLMGLSGFAESGDVYKGQEEKILQAMLAILKEKEITD